MNKWQEAQKWEADWWGTCVNTLGEEVRQLTYANRMGLTEFMFHDGKSPYNFDMQGKSIIDIGGGPTSLLLRCVNVDGEVRDPLPVPDWVRARYDAAGIFLSSGPAEGLREEHVSPQGEDGLWDEAWIYNVLQHTKNPERVIRRARCCARLIRIFEWVGTAPNVGHPHTLTEEQLNEWLGGDGKVEAIRGENTLNGTAYYGVFPTDKPRVLAISKFADCASDMRVHYLNSGPEFPYTYYLGIMSGIHAFGEKVKLWLAETPVSKYFGLLDGKVEVEVYPYRIPDFPMLQCRDPHFQRVAIFDNCIWRIVAEQGGTIMGLDSFTLRPFQHLLEQGHEMLVGIDGPTHPDSFCEHGATVRLPSKLSRQIYEDSTRALNGEDPGGRHPALHPNGRLRFGGSGIIPFLNHTLENREKLSIAPFGVFSGYHHRLELHPDCCTIPYYATSNPSVLSLTEEGMMNNTSRLALAIKRTLPESVWRPFGR